MGLVINKEQVLGIVYNPFLNEFFSALKGKGAYLNGKRIYCSGVKGKTEIKKNHFVTIFLADITKSVLNYELSLARLDSLRDLYMYRLKHLMCVIQG